MLDRLPLELATRIVQQATFDFRFSAAYRQSVVNLASTSHAVYTIVAPILYHTLIVNQTNNSRIIRFMAREDTRTAAARMCSHVRILHFPALMYEFDTSLITSLERVYSSGDFIRDVFAQIDITRHCELRHVTFLTPDFVEDLMKLAAHTREHVTHVCGDIPSPDGYDRTGMCAKPVAWTHQILDALPNVTHLGLVHLAVQRPNDTTSTIDEFDMEALRTVLQTALSYEHRRLRRVALRVGSLYIIRRRGDIEKIVQDINDARLSVWWDERSMSTWDDWKDYECEDAMQERDIWTEARGLF